MKQRLIIPVSSFSINKVHYRDQRYITSEFREWCGQVLHYLSSKENIPKIKYLKENFDPKLHFFKVDITHYYDRNEMFTKQGTISSKIHDVSNIEKPLIDVVFLPRYNGSGSAMKGNNINIDDKYIKTMTSMQKAADSNMIEIFIEIRELQELETIEIIAH